MGLPSTIGSRFLFAEGDSTGLGLVTLIVVTISDFIDARRGTDEPIIARVTFFSYLDDSGWLNDPEATCQVS
jgi:hypothetical protein